MLPADPDGVLPLACFLSGTEVASIPTSVFKQHPESITARANHCRLRESAFAPTVAGLILWHEETARLLTVLLPALDREPLFHLEEGATSEGYPLVAVYGEQGAQVAGWLDRDEPRWAEGLHLLEAIIRSPFALATLLEAAGPGAEEQVGRIRARRQAA